MELIRELPNQCCCPLLVGHNPGLQQLIASLTVRDEHGLSSSVARKFPEAAFAIVELSLERWQEIKPGSGQIVELILPADFR